MYIDQCTYEEMHEPEHAYRFTGPCAVTGKAYTVTIPGPDLFRLRQGVFIQEACPTLSPGDREFVLSGISPEGWEQTFKV